MGIPLRVLLIEDSNNDAELLLQELARGGYETASVMVQTAVDLDLALDRQEWDVVISDYSMPQFEGMAALNIVRNRRKSLPFILVSGKIGEETAVAAMKAGANDYLMKDRLHRLTMVVKRVIEEAHNHLVAELSLATAEIERKRAELEIRDSVQRYRSLVLATSQAIWCTNALGEVVADQPAWRALTGQSAQQQLGGGWLDAIHQDDLDRATRWWVGAIQEGRPCECEFRLNAIDGKVRDVIARGVPVRDDDGRIREWVCACTDVTERKVIQAALFKHQLRLEQSNKRLEELYQTAQCFVDNVSHEFRTPLTVIKGYAEVLQAELAGPINEQQREFVDFILDRSRDLAQMVDDLLDSSKLRVGTLRVNRRPHHIKDIMERVRPMIAVKAAANKIGIVEDIERNLPEVFVDAEKIGRVILNLAVNAVKFSPEGSSIKMWAEPAVAEGLLEIGITDCGPGISPENLQLLFNRFKQVGDAQNGTTKGFGLGLNIARELVALNFGEINVASVVGRGSTFSFKVPLNEPAFILGHFLKNLDALGIDDESICAFAITTVSQCDVTDAVRGLLASILRPKELLLDGIAPSSLLLVGCTSDAEKWLEHLRKSGGSSLQKLIEITPVAAWRYPEQKGQVISGILRLLQMEPTYA